MAPRAQGQRAPKARAKKTAEPQEAPEAAGAPPSGAEPAAKAQGREVSAFLSALKVKTRDSQTNAARAETLAVYKNLSWGSPQKCAMVEAWKADKSCKWISTYKATHSLSRTTTSSAFSGYGTRFDVARLLGMDADKDKETLDKILAEMPSDDAWNESEGIERGYMKAGLRRYRIEGHRGLDISSATDTREESVEASKSRSASSAAPSLLVAPQEAGDAGGGPQIKLEDEGPYQTMHKELKALQHREGALIAGILDLKKQMAAMRVLGCEDGKRRADELARSVALLEQVHEKLITVAAEAQPLRTGDTAITALTDRTKELIEEVDNHLDATKLQRKRVRHFLESL
jgi:hypothetical protein